MQNNNPKQLTPQVQVSQTGRIGATFNIIVAFFWCFTIIGMSWGIPAILINIRYLRTGKQKTLAGILGLFCSFIGGFLVLIADDPIRQAQNAIPIVPPTYVPPAYPQSSYPEYESKIEEVQQEKLEETKDEETNNLL